MTDLLITCRICDVKAPASDDGVLLCSTCRADADAMLSIVNDALVQAEQQLDDVLLKTPMPIYLRWMTVTIEEIRAIDGTREQKLTYQKRRAATLAKGDELAKIVQLDDALWRTRAWHERATEELDALENSV